MLTPEAQLMAAYQAAQQQPMMPQIPLTYNTANEEVGMGLTSAGIAGGTSLATAATMAPGLALMLGGGRLGSVLSNPMLAKSTLGRVGASAFMPITGLLNPFGAFGSARLAARAAGSTVMGSLGMGALATLPGIGLMIGSGMAVDYASRNIFQGAQDYVATRQLMREMPGVGFGATSVLGGGSGLTNLSAGQVSQANQMVQSIGGRHGLDASASRNLLSNLSQTGMIDTSSVRAMSQSYQKALSDFKLMAKTLQIDIDQTIELYKGLDQLGLRGNAERRAVLSRASSTSSLTGKSFDSVMQTVTGAIAAGNSLGLSSYASANVATRAMAVSALAERAGALPESYLNRVGGYDGYTNRMIELELGMSRSSGAMRMMANMFDTSGRFRSDNLLATGSLGRSAGSFFRNADPYELDRMSQEMSSALPSLVLARVDAIQSRHGAGSVRANREQYRFLQTMGIEDPQEQLAFLMSARNAGAGQFVQGLQASNDRVNAAPAAAAESMRRESLTISSALRLMTSSLTTELRAFGEAMQAASEEAAGRIATSRGGLAFSPANFQSTTQQLGVVSEFIRQGRINPFSADPMAQSMQLEGRYRDVIASGLSSSIAFTGMTRAEGRGLLTSGLDRTIARYGYDLPEAIANVANTANRAVLATVFGEDIFDPAQSENDILGGFSSSRYDASGAYTTRRGDDPDRGRVTFGQIMENVANLHGQYYDARTNSVLRVNSAGERQFRNQYGESLNAAMSRFRGDVSEGFRSQLQNEQMSAAGGLTGAMSAGALAGGLFGGLTTGGLGLLPAALVGGLIGGAGYLGYGALTGGFSGLVRSTRESIFGDSQNGVPRMLSADVQGLLQTSQGSAATRNFLTQQVFQQDYEDLSQSQRMYFDNYLRTSPEAADFAGVVDEAREPLNQFEIARLSLNIQQEGNLRNIFTTEEDKAAARSRQNILGTAARAITERENLRIARDNATANMSLAVDKFDRTSFSNNLVAATERFLENERVIENALGILNPAQREAYDAAESDPARRAEILEEAMLAENRIGNLITLNGVDVDRISSQGLIGVGGAMLAIAERPGQYSRNMGESALDLALSRTTQAQNAMSTVFGNFFTQTGDEVDFTRQINTESANTSAYLVANAIASRENVPVQQVLERRVGRSNARNIVTSAERSLSGLSPEERLAITSTISRGLPTGGFGLDMDLIRTAVQGAQADEALNAQLQYASAFEEVSSQNLNVLRQDSAGDFIRYASSIGLDLNERTGSEAFSGLSAEDMQTLSTELGGVRRQIAQARAAGDQDRVAQLNRQAQQIENYINLGTSSRSSTETLLEMAQDALFVNGEFQVGNIGLVTGKMGFAGAGDALGQIGALVSGNERERSAAAAAFTSSDEETAAMARRLGLEEGASADVVRREIMKRGRNNDLTFLQDLVQDILPSVGVEATEEAENDLRRRSYQALIDIADATTFTMGGRAMRTTTQFGDGASPAEGA